MTPSEMPFIETERLRELLLELERARNWERVLRLESDTLLDGLKVLTLSESFVSTFPRLLQVLQSAFEFEQACVLVLRQAGQLELAAFHTGSQMELAFPKQWQVGRFFERVFNGKPIAAYDVSEIPEWKEHDLSFLAQVGSALHVPLKGLEQKALLIATHSQKGFFSARHLSLAKRLALLASQALRQQEMQQALQRLNQELEVRVLERTLELQEANQSLLEAAQLKDEFLANMSHELRTPLSAVLGMTELISREVLGPLTPKQAKSLSTIQESGKHLLTLINDILDLAKIQAGKVDLNLEPICLQELGATALGMVQQLAANKRIQLGFSCLPFDLQTHLDQAKIKQALINLLSNAIKFTPEEGSVQLTIEQKFPFEEIVLAVRDTGIGICEEDQERLFQPFVQIDRGLNRRYGGTGLGLTLVKHIVELHGGKVLVSSRPGQGSLFGLILPFNQKKNKFSCQESLNFKDKDSKISNNSVILVVDDHPSNLDLFSEYLHFLGYSTLLAQSGKDALEILEKQIPDLILTDIQMPEMNGLELIRILRKHDLWHSLPIVALTSLSMPWEKEKIIESGASFYLCKPVDLKVLEQILTSLLKTKTKR